MFFTNLNSMRGTGGRLKDEWDDGEKWNEDFFFDDMMDGAMMMKYDWWDEWCMKWRWGMIRWKMLGWMHEMGWWWWNMMLWYDGANALPEPTPSPSHYLYIYLANTLPTQQKFTLLPRVSAHAYADCKISGQQPAQLHKEFPRTHEVHSKKKRCSFWLW